MPDELIMLAHDIGAGQQGCDDRPGNPSGNVTPADNILSVARHVSTGWTVEDITRVLTAYHDMGHRSLIVDEVLTDLDRALNMQPSGRGGAVVWHEAKAWLRQHDWVDEYTQYIRAGLYNFGDHMVRFRVPFRYGQHLVKGGTTGDRWIDLVEIALLREDGTEPDAALDQLLPYLIDPRVKQESLLTLYTWVRHCGVERAVLYGLAGLSKQEGLDYTGDLEVLQAMAALRT